MLFRLTLFRMSRRVGSLSEPNTASRRLARSTIWLNDMEARMRVKGFATERRTPRREDTRTWNSACLTTQTEEGLESKQGGTTTISGSQCSVPHFVRQFGKRRFTSHRRVVGWKHIERIDGRQMVAGSSRRHVLELDARS